MPGNPDNKGGEIVRSQSNELTTNSNELFESILQSIRKLTQKLEKAKEQKNTLWERFYKFFEAESVQDKVKVTSLITSANREIQNLIKQKAQVHESIHLRRELNKEEKEAISDEVDAKAEEAIAKIISATIESNLDKDQMGELKEIYGSLKRAYKERCKEIHPDQNEDLKLESEDYIRIEMAKAEKFKNLVSSLYFAKDLSGLIKLQDCLNKCSGDLYETYQLFKKDFDNATIGNLQTQLNTIAVENVEISLFLGNIQLFAPINSSMRFEIYYEHLLAIISKQKADLIEQNKELQLAKTSAIVALEKMYTNSEITTTEKIEIKFKPAETFVEANTRLAEFVAGVNFDFTKVDSYLVCENEGVEVKAENSNSGSGLYSITILYRNGSPAKTYIFGFIALKAPSIRSTSVTEDMSRDHFIRTEIRINKAMQENIFYKYKSRPTLFPIDENTELNEAQKAEFLRKIEIMKSYKMRDEAAVRQYFIDDKRYQKLAGSIFSSRIRINNDSDHKLKSKGSFKDIISTRVEDFNELGEELAKYGISI